MTTRIKGKIVRLTECEVFEQGKLRGIVVELMPRAIGFRLAGTRTTYTLGVEGLYHKAVRATVEDAAKQKGKRRKGGRA